MHNYRYYLPGLFMYLGISLAQGQVYPLDDQGIATVKTGIAQAAQTTQTIHSRFRQEKTLTLLEEKILTSGMFWFKKENNLRWEYTDPFRYTIVIRGEVISIRDDERVTAFNTQSSAIFSEINRIIIGSVRGTLLDDPAFTPAFARNNSHLLVTLIPLMPKIKESLEEIVIHFDPISFTVDQLVMKEPGGDQTTIRFYDKRINKPVPDETFILQ